MSTFTCTLDKKGRGRGIGFSRPWTTRTVTISGQSLSYYDGAKKKGEISLAGCKVHMLNPSDADGKPFPFEVEIPSEKMVLNATEDAVRKRVMAICAAAGRTAKWEEVLKNKEEEDKYFQLVKEQEVIKTAINTSTSTQVVATMASLSARKKFREAMEAGDMEGAKDAAALMITGMFRAKVAKKRVIALRRKLAAVKIQCMFRSRKARNTFQQKLARKLWRIKNSLPAAIKIQSFLRGRTVSSVASAILDVQMHAVRVHLISGENLPVADLTTSDPFAFVCGFQLPSSKLGMSGDDLSRCNAAAMTSLYRSPTVSRSTNPVWNHECIVTGVNRAGYVVITLGDKDKVGKDEFLGQVVINLNDYPRIYRGRSVEVTLPLQRYGVPLKGENGEALLETKSIPCKGTVKVVLSIPNRAYTMFGHINKLTETMISSNFKNRYFVLVDRKLHYYGNQFSLHAVKHTINCADVTSIVASDYKGEPVTRINYKDGYWLIKWNEGDTAEYRHEWNRKLFRSCPALEDPVLKKLGIKPKKVTSSK